MHLPLLWRIFRILLTAGRIWYGYRLLAFLRFFLGRKTYQTLLSRIHRRNAVRIREQAVALRGVLIKIGQFLSARVDFLPEEYTSELSRLQDEVPPVPYETICDRIREELGREPEEIYESFEKIPIASASLGQVHRAVLPGGIQAAVKVQYPRIEEVVEADLQAVRILIRFLKRQFRNIRFDVLYQEFSRILRDELNYIQEGRNADLFRTHFAKDPRIVVPRVFWETTTLRVLTLEFVEGIKITRFDEIRRRGISLPEVAALLVESYVIQIFEHRFFHGDPHPGNLFIQEGPRLVFVDFGLMQRITPAMHEGLRMAAEGIVHREIPEIARAMVDLGFIPRTEDPRGIEEVVAHFMEGYRDISPKEFRNVDLHALGREVREILRDHPYLQLPNNFILIGRTVGMLNGLNSQLDPNLNIIDLAKPHAGKFMKEETSGAAGWILREAREAGRSALALPRQLDDFLTTANRDGVTTIMVNRELTDTLGKIYRLGHRLIAAGLILGLTAAYIYFRRTGLSLESWITGGFALILGILFVRTFWRDGGG